MQLRKRTVEFDGVKFVIAPLTLDQVEKYLQGEIDQGNRGELTIKNSDLICLSLNNALGEQAEDGEKWTPERCKKELDPKLFWHLLPDAIMDFTGLARVKQRLAAGEPVVPGAPGEAPATSGT
jgi:hypothetical protein